MVKVKVIVDNLCHSYRIEEFADAILLVKELQDGPEAEGHGEKHRGMTPAGLMRALQQPQGVTEDEIYGDGLAS